MKRGIWVLITAGLVAALPAQATVPSPERIAEAAAATNHEAHRGQPLRLDLRVQIGERPSVAAGVLLSDPAGRVRLELRGGEGLVERHLMLGGQTLAARDGVLLQDHRFFLPPLYVLQADEGESLRQVLEGLDVDVDRVGLAQCGDEDCLVVGDVGREIPRRPPPPVLGLEAYEQVRLLHAEIAAAQVAGVSLEEWRESVAAAAAEEADLLEGETPIPDTADGAPLLPELPDLVDTDGPVPGSEAETTPELPSSWPELWVERKSFAIRGIDSAGGVRIRLGPEATFSGVRVPAWIYIQEPGHEAVQLHVLGLSTEIPDPAAFDPAWLFSAAAPSREDSSPVVPVFPGRPDGALAD